MQDLSSFAQAVITLGVRPLMRDHGFKRPGGGTRFLRDREPVRQLVTATVLRSGELGRLRLRAEQRVGHHLVWTSIPRDLFLDLQLGEVEDVAIQGAAWIEQELLPKLELPLDLVGLARLYEQRPTASEQFRLASAAQLWSALGYPQEAQRVTGALDAWIPF